MVGEVSGQRGSQNQADAACMGAAHTKVNREPRRSMHAAVPAHSYSLPPPPRLNPTKPRSAAPPDSHAHNSHHAQQPRCRRAAGCQPQPQRRI
eukprot:365582-Chlamydomonas_euryale.AAC.9